MTSDMIVYEAADLPVKDPVDKERFERSLEALKAVGIEVDRVLCRSLEDLDPNGEAYDTVKVDGLDALPIAEYQGVEVCTRCYPDDEYLADFLEVPDGVLSVNRSRPPSMGNDIMPACACGNRTK